LPAEHTVFCWFLSGLVIRMLELWFNRLLNLWVQIPSATLSVANLGRLFKHVPLSPIQHSWYQTTDAVMLKRPAQSRPRPWHQGQGQGQNRTYKAYNADITMITLISVQLFLPSLNDLIYFETWLLPVLRLTEVTVTGNSLHWAGKILALLVKLMALTIYAKAGLLNRWWWAHLHIYTVYNIGRVASNHTNMMAINFIWNNCKQFHFCICTTEWSLFFSQKIAPYYFVGWQKFICYIFWVFIVQRGPHKNEWQPFLFRRQ